MKWDLQGYQSVGPSEVWELRDAASTQRSETQKYESSFSWYQAQLFFKDKCIFTGLVYTGRQV